MSNTITGNCYGNKMDSPDTIYRYWGKDTMINSRGVGNIEYVYMNDALYEKVHFDHWNWFCDAIVSQGKKTKLYKTVHIEFRLRDRINTIRDTFFVREEGGQMLMHAPRSDSMLNFDQVLFYYNAKPKVDRWEVLSFLKAIYRVSLTEKQYHPQLKDTLYKFYFSQVSSEPYRINMYISKKYGFVGFSGVCDNHPSICETWYSPY